MSVVQQLEPELHGAEILIVVGRGRTLRGVRPALEQAGARVTVHHDHPDAALLARTHPDLVLIEGQRHDVSIGEIVRAFRERIPEAAVVVSTHRDTGELTLEAMRAGATDCLLLPSSAESLVRCLRRNLDDQLMSSSMTSEPDRSVELVGSSLIICGVRRTLSRAAQSGTTAVLVTGPEGAGKSHAVRFLLGHFPRCPRVRVQCRDVAEPTLEASLFTRVAANRSGLGGWYRARGGFLVLDNVDALPERLQRQLETLIDEQAEQNLPLRERVRVVATLNCSSRTRAVEERLSPRLQHRFSGARVDLPSLAQRPGDLRALAEHFLSLGRRRFDRPAARISDASWQALEDSHWPHNVAQLERAVERALLSSEEDELSPAHFDIEDTRDLTPRYLLPEKGVDLGELERSLVEQALARAKGNRTKAGNLLGINRDQVRYRIEKFGIEVPGR